MPDSAVLYFLGEDGPEGTRLKIEFDKSDVTAVMWRLETTVTELEHTREIIRV